MCWEEGRGGREEGRREGGEEGRRENTLVILGLSFQPKYGTIGKIT